MRSQTYLTVNLVMVVKVNSLLGGDVAVESRAIYWKKLVIEIMLLKAYLYPGPTSVIHLMFPYVIS